MTSLSSWRVHEGFRGPGRRRKWVVGATVKAWSRDRKERTEWREALGGEEARPRDSWAVVGGKARQRKADTWVSTLGMQALWDELRDEEQEEGQVCRDDAEARLAQGWRHWERSKEAQRRRQSRREGSRLESTAGISGVPLFPLPRKGLLCQKNILSPLSYLLPSHAQPHMKRRSVRLSGKTRSFLAPTWPWPDPGNSFLTRPPC